MTATAASPMSVAEFLQRSDALQRKGALAAFSPDTKVLQGEAQASFEAWLAQARPSNACVPKGKTFRGDPQKFLAMLKAVPAAQRQTLTVREAFRRSWNADWKCR